eukprot:gnl/TRDRNA2_/TRDRNA2_135601_c0_seq2.p1 gnl/TRDRNA2_/TRDRNA2_135601_c0~~gnl/TRDRNA2_/TRDRNA2_135601_c0_seq2.p1  ORF type:complete len:235 (+),score=29.36 gnl/TRDRNA2_/TRDRNA2_135601_c0_seq2:75-779(+)
MEALIAKRNTREPLSKQEIVGGSLKNGLGCSSWASRTPYTTNSASAHRQFSKIEMDGVRGSMDEEVKKDLRAVHLVLGMRGSATNWDTASNIMAKRATECKMPEKRKTNFQKGHIRLGLDTVDYVSDSRSSLRQFSVQEMADVKGSMAAEVQKDLRAVHMHLGMDRNRPRQSVSRECLRKFSKEEISSGRGALSSAAQADLRAVHFRLGSYDDEGHYAERSRPRPLSAPHGRRH